MDSTSIRVLGVVGAGQMGGGIAQVAAQAGVAVLLNDVSDAILARYLDNLGRALERLVSKGKISADDRAAALGRIRTTPRIEELAGADLVIEAATEKEALKVDLLKRLNECCPAEVILATNTSSISVTRLGAASGRPEKVIGMHFMNPVPVMQLVEIVRGLATTEETYQTVKALAERLGKTTVVAEDSPGFIVNRILIPMINEAIFALQEKIGSVEDIDTGMKLGTNQPMGPLTLADLIGLDTCLAVMEVMWNGLGEDKYRPCPLLKKYVDAGYLGRKSGRGFYRYDK
jgi:3-hydroxybutyryl-CoA dehydrogenase